MSTKKMVSSIKKLFKARDNKLVDEGVELAISLNDPAVFESLLEGASIDDHGCLVPGRALDGSKPARAYLDRAFLALVLNAPKGCKLHPSLNKGLTQLNLSDALFSELPPALFAFNQLETLRLVNLVNLKNIDGIERLTTLQSLSLNSCTNLKTIRGVEYLKQLREFSARACENLKSAKELQECAALVDINLCFSSAIKKLQLTGLTELKTLALNCCWELGTLELKNLPKLAELSLGGTSESYNYAGIIYNFIGMQTLKIDNLPALSRLDISWAYPLNTLQVSNCPNLEELNREELYLSYATHRTKNLRLQKLPLIRYLRLSGLSISSTKNLRGLDSLTRLDLRGCQKLTDLKAVGAMPSLEVLNVSGCPILSDLKGLKGAKGLRVLWANSCPQLKDVAEIRKINTLCGVDFNGCKSLRPKPDSKLLAGRGDVVDYQRKLYKDAGQSLPKGLETCDAATRKENKETLKKLQTLLKSKDEALIEQAVSLATSLESPRILEQLLFGATWNEVLYRASASVFFSAPRSGPKWKRRALQKSLDSAFASLLKAAPKESLISSGLGSDLIKVLDEAEDIRVSTIVE